MAVQIRQVAEGVQDAPEDDDFQLLDPGDSVMTTCTHEVTVDGEKSWIKHGAITKVRPGETAAEASARLSRFVTKGALKEVQYNVEQIRAFTAQYR